LAALTTRDQHQTSTASVLGFKGLTTEDGPIFAGFTAGWQHRFSGLRATSVLNLAGGTPFTIAGIGLAKDEAIGEMTLGWRLSSRATVSARYSGAIGEGSVDNSVKATLGIAF
jgi:uncharacterized protein with beta-barrel porin domain